MSEETPQLPVSEQVRQPADQIEAPVPLAEASSEGGSFLDKLKLQKKKILIGLGVFFGVLAIVGAIFGAYLIGQRQAQPESPPAGGSTPEVATPTPDPTTDWETYTNDFAKFSIKHPSSMELSERSLSSQEKQIIFSGSEGELIINAAVPTGSGWGGGCDPEDQNEIIFLGKSTKICGGETGVNQLYGTHPDEYSRVQIGAVFTELYSESKEVILLILSTFKFLPSASSGQGEEDCGGMNLEEAREIALASDCVEQGSLKDTSFCNEDTGTWWIDLDIDRPGCAPACVVNVSTKEAVINWRCTGLIPD